MTFHLMASSIVITNPSLNHQQNINQQSYDFYLYPPKQRPFKVPELVVGRNQLVKAEFMAQKNTIFKIQLYQHNEHCENYNLIIQQFLEVNKIASPASWRHSEYKRLVDIRKKDRGQIFTIEFKVVYDPFRQYSGRSQEKQIRFQKRRPKSCDDRYSNKSSTATTKLNQKINTTVPFFQKLFKHCCSWQQPANSQIFLSIDHDLESINENSDDNFSVRSSMISSRSYSRRASIKNFRVPKPSILVNSEINK